MHDYSVPLTLLETLNATDWGAASGDSGRGKGRGQGREGMANNYISKFIRDTNVRWTS